MLITPFLPLWETGVELRERNQGAWKIGATFDIRRRTI
jgi:hypothetical protein